MAFHVRQLSVEQPCCLAQGKRVQAYLQNDFHQIRIACDDWPGELRGPLAG